VLLDHGPSRLPLSTSRLRSTDRGALDSTQTDAMAGIRHLHTGDTGRPLVNSHCEFSGLVRCRRALIMLQRAFSASFVNMIRLTRIPQFVSAALVASMVTMGWSALPAQAASTPHAPPAGLSAAALVRTSASVQSTASLGVEDDGGVTSTLDSGQKAFTSQARTEVGNAILSIRLVTYMSVSAAEAGYNDALNGTTTPIPNLGSEAEKEILLENLKGANCANPTASDTSLCQELELAVGAQGAQGEVAARVGAQVLVVDSTASPSAQAEISQAVSSANASSLSALDEAIATEAEQLAPELVSHMAGKPESGSYFALPRGAAQPCLISTSALAAKLHKPVSATPVTSQAPPSTECDYTVGDYPYSLQIETQQQASSSVPPTTLLALYRQDLEAAQQQPGNGTVTSSSVGPKSGYEAMMFTSPGELFQSELLVVPSASLTSYSDSSTDADRSFLIRLEAGEGRSAGENTTPEDCSDFDQEIDESPGFSGVPGVVNLLAQIYAKKVAVACARLRASVKGE